MQFIFALLVTGGNVILMLDVLPLLYIFDPDKNHMLLPVTALFVNLAFFHLSCSSDPGHISPQNATALASLYKADGIMFKDGVICSTCKTVKPARSKHCSKPSLQRLCYTCLSISGAHY